jgi:hypothetical protein
MENPNFISEEQYDLISEEEAEFILTHAEKQIKELLDTSLLIVSRSTTLLTIIIGIKVGLIGFSISRWEDQHRWDELLFTASWGIGYLFVMTFILLDNFLPRSYLIPGAEPKDFFDNKEVFMESNSEYRLTAIYINEIREAQVKINFNKTTNEKRWKVFRIIIYMTMGLPPALLAFYWGSRFFI